MIPVPDVAAWAISCALLSMGFYIVIGDRLIGARIKQRIIETNPDADVVPPIALVGGLLLAVGVLAYPADMGLWRWAFVAIAFFIDTSWWLGLSVGFLWMGILEKPEPRWLGCLMHPIGTKGKGDSAD